MSAGIGKGWRVPEIHRLGNQAPDLLRRLDQVAVGKVGVARLSCLRWPSSLLTSGRFSPYMTARLAAVWRRS